MNRFSKMASVALLCAAFVSPSIHAADKAKPKPQTARIEITDKGYEPASFKLKKGVPARVTFVRKTDATCGTEVLLPDYKIKKDLPLNKPVVVSFTPSKSGTFTFTCGMKMMKGQVVVK